MSTIQETVQDALTSAGYGSYSSYATPVVTALVNREQQIVGHLIEFAQGQDLNTEAVANALRDAGMHMPAPAAASPIQTADAPEQDTESGGLEATLARIEETLSGLTAFARQNGYRG